MYFIKIVNDGLPNLYQDYRGIVMFDTYETALNKALELKSAYLEEQGYPAIISIMTLVTRYTV